MTKNSRFSRLCRTFKTKSDYYIYDVGTGKVFQVDDTLYRIFNTLIKYNSFKKLFEINISNEILLEKLKEVQKIVEFENILKAPTVKELTGDAVVALDDRLLNRREQLTLELTEKCNMRCKYCIYHDGQGGYRNFGNKDMTFDVAKKAIDEFMRDSTKSDQVSITFYGGEPLVKFDLIKQCVEYCQDTYKNRIIDYSMTTNATLIDEEIADWLANLKGLTHMLISIDGPRNIHNSNRIFKNGEGTFDATMRGLNLLVKAMGEEAGSRIGINAVFSEELTKEEIESIQGFVNSLEWTNENTRITYSYTTVSDEDVEYNGIDSEREVYLRSLSETNPNFSIIDKINYSNLASSNNKTDYFDNVSIDGDDFIKRLYFIHNRFLTDEPVSQYRMNGCCIPGARRTYVTTEGKYMPCERLGSSPKIGDVYNGINIDEVRNHYVDSFRKEALKYCGNCWAIHLCTFCYMNCFDEEGVRLSYRHDKCEVNRIMIERCLSEYHEILEKHPDAMQVLEEYSLI
ncbi:radical SAM domain-containing protein [Gottschalkia acidurici 9a]|uniref:Radical SAM domain-containing protein n=1 Tax=Gottschalkia acidurici (strain ATCC 7906 / DSM 604 / BCRC 14475 / CIP 104303 / KCTC 5404 / NCIMB 10678 / 9a) TaxID=1128398 RepID=K0AWM8_GOTA9|nr:radical SAM protein [Gottschalkia acidurici]AFS77135.1 radical SAM domain-containing protein [Gottschalkia acidurici 9a]